MKENINNLHPKIQKFALDMQKELDNNQHKGNFEDFTNINDILFELEWHKAKLYIALRNKDKNSIREYLADCGNILMFLGNANNLYND